MVCLLVFGHLPPVTSDSQYDIAQAVCTSLTAPDNYVYAIRRTCTSATFMNCHTVCTNSAEIDPGFGSDPAL